MSGRSRVLGIDPGSRVTGFGVVECVGGQVSYLGHGCVRTGGDDLGVRLRTIHDALAEVVERWQPLEVSVERVFMSRNADSALKLGQARGAAIAACACRGLEVHEYTAGQIKQSVTGHGRADKQQIQHMVRLLLGLGEAPAEDAADALAAAICHGHFRNTRSNLAVALS